MKVYRTVIRIGAICDLIISLCAFLISVRVYSTGVSLVIMFHGFSKYFLINQNLKPYVCFFIYTFGAHGYLFSLFVIIFSLYYRERIVTNYGNPLTASKVNWICYSFCCIAIPYIIFLAVSNIVPLEQIDELIMRVKPELYGSGWIYYAILNVSKFPDVISEGLMLVLNFITIIFGLICRSRINQKLSSLPMSEGMKNMQKSLMKILLIQITSPLFQIIGLILHIVSTFQNDFQSPLVENLIELPLISVASITPIFTIYYIAPYRTVIRLGAICDLTISLCAILKSSRIFSTGTSIVLMFHGFAKYFPINQNLKPYVCFFIYTFGAHGYLFSLFVIIFSLYYRERIVVNPENPITASKVNWICYTFCCIALLFTIYLAVSNIVPLEQIDELIMRVKPELYGSGWIYYAILNVSKFPDVISEGLMLILNFVTIIFGLVCRSRINKKLASLTMSEGLKTMQKSLMKILLIQITSPLFQILGFILHIVSTFQNDFQSPLVENSVGLPLILLASATPMFTIYYIAPYRYAFKQLLGVHAIIPVSIDLPITRNSQV
ncbi:unnamed protein product [Caenorhabditis angaria]|uniref:G protein-coupled receptor n=1 Tax=Caenorhabditis angaria TaxID=860376 RepID=A0A9P1N950_9PELO|nr:unnamed protein product [Caenorhabditis angaria]